MSDDPRTDEIAALRQKLAALCAATNIDPREAELAWLRHQVKILVDEITRSVQPPKPRQWVMLPTGQCIPAELMMATHQEREAAGFRWEGNKPIFPADWPKYDLGA